jgi:hypothetical protein
MDSRRLVVWISTGILGFQGATLAFDLLNCTAMGWLYVRMNGLTPQAQQIDATSAQGKGNPGGPQQPSEGSTAEQITTDFCSRSQGRIDAAVTKGLGILAGLALGSSVPGRGAEQP